MILSIYETIVTKSCNISKNLGTSFFSHFQYRHKRRKKDEYLRILFKALFWYRKHRKILLLNSKKDLKIQKLQSKNHFKSDTATVIQKFDAISAKDEIPTNGENIKGFEESSQNISNINFPTIKEPKSTNKDTLEEILEILTELSTSSSPEYLAVIEQMLSQLNGKKSPKENSNINSNSTKNGDTEILADGEIKCTSDIATDNNHTSNTKSTSDDKHQPCATTKSESRDTAESGSLPSSDDVDINSNISISNYIVDVEGANSITTVRSEVSSKDIVSTIPVPLEAIPIAQDFSHLLAKKSNVVDELNIVSRSSTPKRNWLNSLRSEKETVASLGGKVQRRSSVTSPEQVCYNYSEPSSITSTGNATTSSFLDKSTVPPNVTIVGCQVVPVIPVKSVNNSVSSVTPETRQ